MFLKSCRHLPMEEDPGKREGQIISGKETGERFPYVTYFYRGLTSLHNVICRNVPPAEIEVSSKYNR